LKPKSDELFSSFALNFKLRRYFMAALIAALIHDLGHPGRVTWVFGA
jgi:hypothetical protein